MLDRLSSPFLSSLFFSSALSSFYFTFSDISSTLFSNSFIGSITSVVFKFGEIFPFSLLNVPFDSTLFLFLGVVSFLSEGTEDGFLLLTQL